VVVPTFIGIIIMIIIIIIIIITFVCKRAPSRSARHHTLNDLIARSFASAEVPVTEEPSELFRTNGKRPDGLTLVPWQSGKSMCWDVTVIVL